MVSVNATSLNGGSSSVLAWGFTGGDWALFPLVALGILLIVGLLLAAVAVLRLLVSVFDNTAIRLGGEISSFVPRGAILLGTRIGRLSALHSVISRLALITRLNLPLPTALEAAASRETYWVRRALRILSRRVIAGESLSKALPTSFPGVPVSMTASLARAEQSGQLPRALTELERAMDLGIEVRLSTTAHIRHAVTYSAFVILFVGVMLMGFMAFILPKFRKIFEDFETPFPPATKVLFDLLEFAGSYGPVLLMVAICVVLAPLALAVLECARPGSVTGWVAQVRARLPVARTLDFSLGMAKVVRSLLLDTRAGVSFSSSESLAAVVGAANPLRFRLAAFSRQLQQGFRPHKAAQAAGLGDVFVRAMRMIERGDDPETVLGHAANYYDAIAYRWWQRIGALAGPLTSLALGLLVGFVAYAMFVPLIALIHAVAETI